MSESERERAAQAVAYLEQMAPDLRGCAILDAAGEPLAASGDPERWREPARELLAAADAAGGERAEHVHVGTEEGEAFAVRHRDLVMVAVTERFTLASLMVFDMRSLLRDLTEGDETSPGRVLPSRPNPNPSAADAKRSSRRWRS